jgi:hypothetical protein
MTVAQEHARTAAGTASDDQGPIRVNVGGRRRHRPRVRPCDLGKMQMHVCLNGSFAAPHGVVFELAPDAMGDSPKRSGLQACAAGRGLPGVCRI